MTERTWPSVALVVVQSSPRLRPTHQQSLAHQSRANSAIIDRLPLTASSSREAARRGDKRRSALCYYLQSPRQPVSPPLDFIKLNRLTNHPARASARCPAPWRRYISRHCSTRVYVNYLQSQ